MSKIIPQLHLDMASTLQPDHFNRIDGVLYNKADNLRTRISIFQQHKFAKLLQTRPTHSSDTDMTHTVINKSQ